MLHCVLSVLIEFCCDLDFKFSLSLSTVHVGVVLSCSFFIRPLFPRSCFRVVLRVNVTRALVLFSPFYERAFHLTLKLAIFNELTICAVLLFCKKVRFNGINYETRAGLESFRNKDVRSLFFFFLLGKPVCSI